MGRKSSIPAWSFALQPWILNVAKPTSSRAASIMIARHRKWNVRLPRCQDPIR
jgi:hypothetical protein